MHRVLPTLLAGSGRDKACSAEGDKPVELIGVRPPHGFADPLLDVSNLVRRPVGRGERLIECDLDFDHDHRLIFSTNRDVHIELGS